MEEANDDEWSMPEEANDGELPRPGGMPEMNGRWGGVVRFHGIAMKTEVDEPRRRNDRRG